MKGDTWSEIEDQGDKPVVGLIDFGAAIVAPAVYESPDPDFFVAEYDDQWHGAATHGRLRSKDPFAVRRSEPVRVCMYVCMYSYRSAEMIQEILVRFMFSFRF